MSIARSSVNQMVEGSEAAIKQLAFNTLTWEIDAQFDEAMFSNRFAKLLGK